MFRWRTKAAVSSRKSCGALHRPLPPLLSIGKSSLIWRATVDFSAACGAAEQAKPVAFNAVDHLNHMEPLMTHTLSARGPSSSLFKQLKLAGAAALLSPLLAFAAPVDLSTGPFETSVNKFSNAPFTDVFDFVFTSPAGGTVSSSAIEIKLGRYVDIQWDATKAFAIYSDFGGMGTELVSFSAPLASTGSFFVEDLPVDDTTFSIVIKGQAVGDGLSTFQPGLKGHYDLNVMAQPVPEPASLALSLAGLAFLGAAGKRRKSEQQPTVAPALT